jgi:hypothetical protein
MRLRIVLLLCLLNTAESGRAASPIIDSGAWVRSGGNSVIYWLDDKRIIFLGHDGIKPQSGGEIRFAMLEWRVGGKTTVLREDVDSLCYRPQQVRFVVGDKRSKKRTVYQGPLGHEVPVQPKGYDALNCASSSESTSASGHRIRQLRPGDGYLDLGPASNRATPQPPITYIATDGRQVRLPFTEQDIFGAVRYYEFQKAYFFILADKTSSRTGVTNVPPPGSRAKAIWLWPDGKIQPIDFPSDLTFPEATRAGLIYRITALADAKNGLYLLTGNEKREVISAGYVTEMSVAPDGCLVAFAHAPDRQSNMTRPKNRRTLKVANVCSRRTN